MTRISEAFSKGDFQRCEALLKVQLASNPKDPESLVMLAQVLQETDRSALAAKVLLNLVMSTNAEDIHQRVAERLFSQMTRTLPQDPVPHKGLAWICEKSGNFVGALRFAQKGLELDPEDRELVALMNRAAERAADESNRKSMNQRGAPIPDPLRYGRRTK